MPMRVDVMLYAAKRERRAGCRTAALDETPAGDGVSGD